MEPSSKVEPFRNNGNFQKDVISTKPNNTYLLVDYKIAKKIICEIKTSRYYYSFFFYSSNSILLESAKGHNPNTRGTYKRDTQLGRRRRRYRVNF